MIPEHEVQATRAQVEDLRAEARSLLNEGHKLRARLVSEAADGLARLLEERETLRERDHACTFHWPTPVDGCGSCSDRFALSASPEEARDDA